MTLKKTSLTLTALFAATLLAFSAQAKIITDVDGNQVEIADRVERVADLWHANNQIVLLLGRCRQIGRNDHCHCGEPLVQRGLSKYKKSAGVNQR